ncbi:MAG: hypothetical protein A3C53_04520 [Omnitrophica WOR_2 bacterium RIFCSPHIGHO2_02_FULL_68_15]|nr:MAG: hypothetical protein A3C53_04520 [Omnitrophica WOR_2 bacterium RIFCSPHIGHO2_02_FULL_68_15]
MTRPYPLILRLVSATLVAALVGTSVPAYALRTTNAGQEESPVRQALQAGLEERPLDINSPALTQVELVAYLRQLNRISAATLVENPQVLDRMAAALLATRAKQSGGVFRAGDLPQKLYGKAKQVNQDTWNELFTPQDPFTYGHAPRQWPKALVTTKAKVTTTAAVALILGITWFTVPHSPPPTTLPPRMPEISRVMTPIQPIPTFIPLPTDRPGHLFYEFDEHGPAQTQRIIQRIQQALQDYRRVVLVYEQGQMDLSVFAQADPALANSLRQPSDLDNPLIAGRIDNILTNNVWSQPHWIRQNIRDPQAAAQVGHQAPLFQLLADHPKIILVVEQVPSESQRRYLRSQLLDEQAWSLLYEQNRLADAAATMVQAYQHERSAQTNREPALAALMRPWVPVQPGTAVIVERGAQHRPLVELVGADPSAQTVTDSSPRLLKWGDVELEQWAGAIERREPLPPNVERVVLGLVPWDAVVRARQEGGATAGRAMEDTARLLNRLNLDEMRTLTQHLQSLVPFERQQGGLTTQRQRGLFVREQTLRWLAGKGYLQMRPAPATPPQRGGLEETARAAADKTAVILVKPVDMIAPALQEWVMDGIIRVATDAAEAQTMANQLRRQGIANVQIVGEHNFSPALDQLLQSVGVADPVTRERILEDLRTAVFA